jgi:hypothetical protein
VNNINVNSWANSEIVRIIKEQTTEIAWAVDSRKSQIQLPMFSKLHAIVDYGSLERYSLGSVYKSCEIGRKNDWHPMNFVTFEVFSIRVFVNAMVSPFLN